MRILGPVLLFFFLAHPVSAQDVVRLENGKTYEGAVVYADHETVVLRKGGRRGGKDRSFERAEVAELELRIDALRELLDRARRVDWQDVPGNLGLSDYALQNGLEGEARLFLMRVLLVDPDHPEANKSLGNRKRGKTWTLAHRGKHYSLEKLHDLTQDWGGAWELDTLHYHIRASLPLRDVISVAMDLERFYLEFYDRFAVDLGMYQVSETLNAHLHGSQRSFPQEGGRIAYFAGGDNTLRVDASGGVDPGTVIHEACHQILFTVAQRERTNSGSVPAWVDEGLAEYFAATVSGRPGSLSFDQPPVNLHHFANHAHAEKPFKLSRVLNFRVSDFQSGSKSGLAYSQSYSLVHFLLHSGEGEFRDRFHGFLRGNFAGKASPTHFKKAMEIDDDDLAELWFQYALERAGG